MRPIQRAHFEVWSMHLASIGREFVMTVNIPVKERNTTCRIIASVVAYQDGNIATVTTMR